METAVREDNSLPSDIDVATIMYSWTSQAGFPLLTVNRNYDSGSDTQTVSLSQERYFTTHIPNNVTWWIPINYATSLDPSFDDTTPAFWQNQIGMSFTVPALASNDWLLINKQASGYFRIMYDETNYRLLSDAMVRNISLFHKLNRAQLIDDAYNFVRSERLGYATLINLVRFLANDHEYASWYPANTVFNAIDRPFAGHADYPLFTVNQCK